MTHSTIKNPFKNQGLAILTALAASFGKRFGKKKLFKINDLPQMAQIVNQNGVAWSLAMGAGKKQVKENVNEM